MTKNDWHYLLWFGGILIIFAVAVISKSWSLAIISGFIVFLFVVHLSLNLMSPPSGNKVLSLLKIVEGSTENRFFLEIDDSDGYSEWDAFCDTPIINDRFLNSIRVKCQLLREAAISQRKSIDAPIVLSENAKLEIRTYIREIEERYKPRV